MTEHDRIEQLAALLDGEDVPDASSSLGVLADLATTVRDHADLMEPTPAFRSSLRAELVAAAAAPPGLVERARAAWAHRTADLRASARIAVATMTASSMIGSAGVAVAAQDALPGDLLYGLKSLTEDARLALAANSVAEARLHLAFARERLQELRTTAGQLDTDQVVGLLAEMDAHSEAGAEAMLAGVSAGAVDRDEVRQFTQKQRDGLVGVLNDLPLLAKPMAEDSLELLRRIEITASGTTSTSADCDCDRDGLQDDRDQRTPLGAPDERTEQRLPSTEVGSVDVTLPGDQPAVPRPDCDCIELPGGSEAREEPATSQGEAEEETSEHSGEPEEPEDPDQDPGQESIEPTDELADADPDPDDGKRSDRLLDAPTSVEQLPAEESVDVVEETTEAVSESTDPVGDLQDTSEGPLPD